jgi:ankyrin repeat protein
MILWTFALDHGREKMVQMLLDRGADVNATGGEYGHALYAASASFQAQETVAQILLNQGADINAQ